MNREDVRGWVYNNVMGDKKSHEQLWKKMIGAFRHAAQNRHPSYTMVLPISPDGKTEKVRFSSNKLRRGLNGNTERTGYGIEILPPEQD